MSSFILLAAPELLDKACADLTSQFEFTKRRHGLWIPDEILGFWVGAESDITENRSRTPDSSRTPQSQRAFGARDVVGVDGLWRMLSLGNPCPSRRALLETLVAGSSGTPSDQVARFTPVFPQSLPQDARRSEFSLLSALHPAEVQSPLLMHPMTGALSREPACSLAT